MNLAESISAYLAKREEDGLTRDDARQEIADESGVDVSVIQAAEDGGDVDPEDATAIEDALAVLDDTGAEEDGDVAEDDGEDAERAPRARWAIPVDERQDEWRCPQVGRAAAKLVKPDEKLTEFIISTGKEARDGDIIDQATWLLDEYLANPVVLDNHDMREVVGTAARVRSVDGDLRAAVRWDQSRLNPRGRLVASQHRRGMRRATSVRWMTGRSIERNKLAKTDPNYSAGQTVEGWWGSYLRVGRVLYDCGLLEISSVSVPSDPRALQVRGMDRAQALRQMRQQAEQVPDPGVARDLGVLLDPATWADERIRDHFRGLLIHLGRTDRQVRAVFEALGLRGSTARAARTPTTTRSPVSGFDAFFPELSKETP